MLATGTSKRGFVPERSDARRELINRIVASPTFVKSARLSAFLVYVCELTIEGRAHEINEQRIGEAVFGRPAAYDSATDGIVRTQASRLRQRLETYFSEEGAAETLRVTIPRGGYVPIFESRPQVAETPAPLPLLVVEEPAFSGKRARQGSIPSARFAWGLATILCAILIAVLVTGRNPGAAPVPQPIHHPLWSRLFSEGQTTLVVPGDSGLVLWEGIQGHNMSLAEYLTGDYRVKDPSVSTLAVDLANRRYTSIVDLDIANFLSQQAQSGRGRMLVRYARDLRPNDLKQGNAILVGAQEANPWVELFEHNMNFVFFNDRVHRVFSVQNRNPRADEPSQWDSAYSDSQHKVFGVVAFLPNLSGNGNVLILEGTSMSGTESAGDFVADDSQLLPFLKKISKSDGTFPHFEIVLGTNNMGGSAAKGSVLAYRITD